MTATNPGPHVTQVTALDGMYALVECPGVDDGDFVYTNNLTPLDEWLDSDDGRAWLAAREIFMPPLLSELVAWSKAHPGNKIERFIWGHNEWQSCAWGIEVFLRWFSEYGDYRMHGYRIPVAPPEPELSRWAEEIIDDVLNEIRSDADLAAIAKAVTEAQEAKPCATCGGEGVERVQTAVDAYDEGPCSDCNGTGHDAQEAGA